MSTAYPELFAALAAPLSNEAEVRYIELERAPGYRVGDDGSVQSDLVKGTRSNRRTGIWRNLKPSLHKRSGYFRVNIAGKVFFIHTLVLETFVGPKPPGMECLHWDGDGANNRLSNLRWGTHQENVEDSMRLGTIPHGSRHWNAKMDEDQVREARSLLARGLRVGEVASLLGVRHQTMSKISLGYAWKDVV